MLLYLCSNTYLKVKQSILSKDHVICANVGRDNGKKILSKPVFAIHTRCTSTGAVGTTHSGIYTGCVDRLLQKLVPHARQKGRMEQTVETQTQRSRTPRDSFPEECKSWFLAGHCLSVWKYHRVCCWLLVDEILLGFPCSFTESRSCWLPGRGQGNVFACFCSVWWFCCQRSFVTERGKWIQILHRLDSWVSVIPLKSNQSFLWLF